MTIPVWPSDLPEKVHVERFGSAFKPERLKTTVEAGPAKIRRRSSSVPRPMTGKFYTDADGYSRLLQFWNTDLEGGVLPFYMADQILDGAPLLDPFDDEPITDENDEIITVEAWWLVQFDTEPEISAIDGLILTVALNLSILA